MPTSKYDKLKSQFDEACRLKTVSQFIQTLESKNQNSYIVHFFLGCAYEELGDSDKAYQYYLLTVKQANRDKSTVQIVKAIDEFVKKTGRKDLTEIIIQRRLPGAVITQPKKQPSEKTPVSKQPKPKVQPTEPPTAKTPAPKQPKPKAQPTEPPTVKTPAPKQPKPKAQPTEPPTVKTPAPKQPKPKAQPTEPPTVKTPAPKQPKPKAQPSAPAPLTPEQAFAEAKIALSNKNIDLAMQHFEYAYVGGLRSAQFLYMLAQTFQRLKQYDEAIIYLDMGLSLYPNVDNQILFMNLLAQIYSSQKKHTHALNSYAELVNLYIQKGNNDKKRFALIQMINLHRKSEQYDQAQAILHDLLTEFPQDRYLLQLQVAMQSPITQSVIEDAQSQIPEISVEEAFDEAKEAFQDNELNKVLEILESVYSAGFISDEFIHILTETFYRLGRYDSALSYLDEGIRQYRDTDTLIAFFTLKAQIYAAQKRWGDAVTMYETLLRLNDDKERSWQRYFIFIEMIKLYRKLGQSQSITSVLKDLKAEFPNEPFTLHIQAKLNTDDDPSTIATILDDAPIQLDLANGQIDPVNLMLVDNDKKSDYIQRLAHQIEDLIVLINETAVHYKIPMIFTPTNRDAIIYRYLRIPVKDRETFTHFASHLYLLIFDRTQTRNRQRPLPLGLLPPEFQRQHTFPKEVDSIRHFYGNAHITDLETWQPPQNSIPVADILERYLGSKKSPHDSQFIDLQYGLLTSLCDYLNDLHQHIAKG